MKKLKLRNNPYRGRLLVFEGTDGAGKTTLIELTRISRRKEWNWNCTVRKTAYRSFEKNQTISKNDV